MRKSVFAMAIILTIMVAGVAFAGSLDQTAAPTDPATAMYTLESIYQRLAAGTAGAKRVGPFAEPTSGPGATGHTLDEVMGLIPAIDNTNGATAGDVMTGKTFWGLVVPGGWGLQTGTLACAATATGTALSTDVLTGKTFSNSSANGIGGSMPNNGAFGLSCGAANQTVNLGYYSGGTLTGDADLISANIKSGISIFGVAGNTNVVDTSAGTAAATDILSGKTAFVNGAAVTGSVPAGSNITGANGLLSMTITDGLYSGSKTATAADTNLTAANIASGKTIFGVTGTAIVRTCTGTLSAGGRWCDYGAAVGTVMDMTTGLVWMRNAKCTMATVLAGITNSTGYLNWSDAVIWSSAVSNGVCGLSDSSAQGAWRLPTMSELKVLTTGTEKVLGSSPGPFTNVQAPGYWSATTYAANPSNAWFVDMNIGGVIDVGKSATTVYVWPVR